MERLYIKNMVCDRCRMSVRKVLDESGIRYTNVELGEVEMNEKPDAPALQALEKKLTELGFELISDKNSRIVSAIKSSIIELVRSGAGLKVKLSVFLAEKLGKDYGSISRLFTEVEGMTIEQFFIHQKIEFVKELLAYDELSLGEIADKLHYSSIQHLSSQFKKVTGLTPSYFKAIGSKRRIPLDAI